MKIISKFAAMVLILSFALPASAVTATGQVGLLRHYGSGSVLVYGLAFQDKSAISHCSGTQGAFLIPHDYAKFDQLLSIILTAKAAGKNLKVAGLSAEATCWAPAFTSASYLDMN